MNSTRQVDQAQKTETDTLKKTKRYEDDKRKADTDANNFEFDKTLAQRAADGPDNFRIKNIQRVHSMNSGRPLKERLNIPEGVDVFQYGSQKLNIWEFQKEHRGGVCGPLDIPFGANSLAM